MFSKEFKHRLRRAFIGDTEVEVPQMYHFHNQRGAVSTPKRIKEYLT